MLSEAQVDLNPHQVEAALFAFKSPLSRGAILADEVGLGKTIEAGIILSQLWAEHKRHILIIVPASLRSQWNIELQEKFYIPSIVVDSKVYSELNGNGLSKEEKAIICSYQFATRFAQDLSQIKWDLVVMDEAHKLRNVYKNDNVMGKTLKKALSPYKKILLTATPLQNNLKELYGLVSIISDNIFYSASSFDSQYNSISTRDSAKFGDLKNRLSKVAYRTLRRQVQEYVKYTRRSAILQEFSWDKEEQQFYSDFDEFLHREFLWCMPEKVRPLLSLLLRKIMASSCHALSCTLDSMITHIMENGEGEMGNLTDALLCETEYTEDWPIADSTPTPSFLMAPSLKAEIEELKVFRDRAKTITEESKANSLLKGLHIGFSEMKKLGAPQKALIFTESRRTQEFLYSFLSQNGYKDKIVCFNGTNNSPEAIAIYKAWLTNNLGTSRITGNVLIDRKQSLVDFFRNYADIMIATEAGAEGINLQFCSLVVNYDMPWNPQRIEQRIGRCHRYGQKYDVVVINFLNRANLADKRVYELLSDKFKLFDGVFGCSDEILGAIDAGIDFEHRLNLIYQTCRTEPEIESAFASLQAEMEEIIKERIKHTRKSLLENFDEEVVQKLKMRQTTDEVFVNQYLNHLWRLACAILKDSIEEIDPIGRSFLLREKIDAPIPVGKYTLNRNFGDKYHLRVSSPLGEWIIAKALKTNIPTRALEFDLSSYGYKMSLLEPYRGEWGYMNLYRVKCQNDFDNSEELISVAVTKTGEILPPEFGFKLLELPCIDFDFDTVDSSSVSGVIISEFKNRFDQYTQGIQEVTEEYVNSELQRIEAWCQDQVEPQRLLMEVLNKESKSLKAQIRRERKAAEALRLKEISISKDRELRNARKKYFDALDECEDKSTQTLAQLKKKMQNSFSHEKIFEIIWHIR